MIRKCAIGLIVFLCLFTENSDAQKVIDPKSAAPDPTFENVRYGHYETDILDFWKADSNTPAPLIVFIHGGGFFTGDKSTAIEEQQTAIKKCLANGVSFASINYRFTDTLGVNVVVILKEDIARAIQFLRYKSGEWNIDRKRIAAFGASAGAGASLWLAFHDDLADPASKDPVLRESTRLAAAGSMAGQACYDVEQWAGIENLEPNWIKKYNFEYDLGWYGITRNEVNTEKGRKIRHELDFLSMISTDDPPVFLITYVPNTDPVTVSDIIHHPRHSLKVKEVCDKKGVEAIVVLEETPTDKRTDLTDFLFEKLKVNLKKNKGNFLNFKKD